VGGTLNDVWVNGNWGEASKVEANKTKNNKTFKKKGEGVSWGGMANEASTQGRFWEWWCVWGICPAKQAKIKGFGGCRSSVRIRTGVGG